MLACCIVISFYCIFFHQPLLQKFEIVWRSCHVKCRKDRNDTQYEQAPEMPVIITVNLDNKLCKYLLCKMA